MDDIRIDIAPYFREHGKKPSGRGYWSFRIVSDAVTVKDHVLTIQEETAFKQACKRAIEVATLRRSKRIVLLP